MSKSNVINLKYLNVKLFFLILLYATIDKIIDFYKLMFNTFLIIINNHSKLFTYLIYFMH